MRKKYSILVKEFTELLYWKINSLIDKKLDNKHYEFFYTDNFNLSKDFYNNKTILDIGCGPRGSLEWASQSKRRVGLDPLADKYLKMAAKNHEMEYVKGYAEDIPFPDNSFDIVGMFNSLDHVEDIEQVCLEVQRVLKPAGLLLIIVDIHKYPTITEPKTIKWTFIEEYFSTMEIIEQKHLKAIYKTRIYSNVRANITVDTNKKGNGVLTALLKKE